MFEPILLAVPTTSVDVPPRVRATALVEDANLKLSLVLKGQRWQQPDFECRKAALEHTLGHPEYFGHAAMHTGTGMGVNAI